MAQTRAGGQSSFRSIEQNTVLGDTDSSMLASLLNTNRVYAGLVRGSPGCAVRLQETVFKLFYSSQTQQAPESRQESSTDTSTDPFLAHLQQKTEKELFEILRKQQQQPSTQDDDEETSVSISNKPSLILQYI